MIVRNESRSLEKCLALAEKLVDKIYITDTGSTDNTVEIALYQGDWTYEMGYEGVPAGVPVISPEVLKQVKEIDNVDNASLYLSRQDYGGVYHLNTT